MPYVKEVRKRYLKRLINEVVKSSDEKFLSSDLYSKSKFEKNVDTIEPDKVLSLIQSDHRYLDPILFRKLILKIDNIVDLEKALSYLYGQFAGTSIAGFLCRRYPVLDNIAVNVNELDAKNAILSRKFPFLTPYLVKNVNDPKIAKELLLAGHHYKCLVDKIEKSQDAKELLISTDFEDVIERALCSKIDSGDDAFEVLMANKSFRLDSLMALCRKLESIDQILKIQQKYICRNKKLNSLLEKKLELIKNTN